MRHPNIFFHSLLLPTALISSSVLFTALFPEERLGTVGTSIIIMGVASLISWLFARRHQRDFTASEYRRIILYCICWVVLIKLPALFFLFDTVDSGLRFWMLYFASFAVALDSLFVWLAFRHLGRRIIRAYLDERSFGIADAQSVKPANRPQTPQTHLQQAATSKTEKNVMAEVEKANEILAMSGERIEVPIDSSDKDTLLLILSAYKRVMNRDISPNDTLAIRRAQLQTDRANAHLMLLMTQIRQPHQPATPLPATAPTLPLAQPSHTGMREKDKSVTTSQSQVQNLLRWEKSGFPQKWVEDHRGQWTHSDWLDLLKKLKLTDYWPMEPNAIGQVLEKTKNFAEKQQLASATLQVKFKRDVRKQHPMMSNIQTITKTYSAPNREVAVAFLRKQNITESFLYIEVVTPSGIFGTDKMREIYDTGGELPGDSSSLLDKPTPTTKRDTSQPDTPEWKSLSQTFYDMVESGDLEKVRAMLKEHPNLVFSRIVHFGNTPLHATANRGRRDVLELLLAEGADVNVRNQNHETPLHYAHKDVVALLLSKGADVNAKMHLNVTPLHNAASNGYKEVVSLLLANKAAVNARTDDGVGKTPLHIAAEKGHSDVAELLLANGADINAKTESGNTPLRYAVREGKNDVAELLRQHGGKE